VPWSIHLDRSQLFHIHHKRQVDKSASANGVDERIDIPHGTNTPSGAPSAALDILHTACVDVRPIESRESILKVGVYVLEND